MQLGSQNERDGRASCYIYRLGSQGCALVGGYSDRFLLAAGADKPHWLRGILRGVITREEQRPSILAHEQVTPCCCHAARRVFLLAVSASAIAVLAPPSASISASAGAPNTTQAATAGEALCSQSLQSGSQTQ
jgi:hypothetical protein